MKEIAAAEKTENARLTKKDIEGVPAVSCVESYALAYLGKRMDVRKLYAESFLPFGRTLKDFAAGARYENYPLPRIQDTAEKLGVWKHECFSLPEPVRGRLNLMEVNDYFFYGAKQRPWRADHFITLDKAGENLRYLNCYPLSEGEFGRAEALRCFGGRMLSYAYSGGFDESAYEKLAGEQYSLVCRREKAAVPALGALPLRNAAAILKVSRQRTLSWLRHESGRGAFFFDETLENIAEKLVSLYKKLIVAAELMSIKKNENPEVLKARLADIALLENKFAENVRRKRR